MRIRLLELLACPHCGETLAVDAWEKNIRDSKIVAPEFALCSSHCARFQRPPSEVAPSSCVTCVQEEITEGFLSCANRHVFPLIGGIPRLLSEPLCRESLGDRYTAFLTRFATAPQRGNAKLESVESEHVKRLATSKAFGYQWTTFTENYQYFRSIFESFVRPYLLPENFRGKLVLEVGCGSGRPATVAAGFGAEVVAVDLSIAVEAAYAMSQKIDGLHVVQGDAYQLPVKPMFDFVYSVGVLQHILDPAAALSGMARVLRPGQHLVLWVYGIREAWYQPIEWLRKLTTRMPFWMVRSLSHVLALLSELFLLIPYRILKLIPATSNFAESIPGRIYARLPYRENVLGWFDRLIAPVTYYFSEADLRRLLSAAGFEDVNLYARPDASASWVVDCVRAKASTQPGSP